MPDEQGRPVRRHFIVTTLGSVGDFNPFFGIAVALRARGHRVTLVTNQIFEQAVVDAGLAFHPIGTAADGQQTLNNPDLWHPRKGFALVWKSLFPAQALIADFILAQRDASGEAEGIVVLAHPLTLPGAVVARDKQPRIKLLAAYLAPANLRTCHDPLWIGPLHIPRWIPHGLRQWLWNSIDQRILDPLALSDVNSLRAIYELAPISHYASLMYDAPDAGLTLFPDWFGREMPDWPARLRHGVFPLADGFAAQSLNDEVRQFLAEGEPPIVFTFGSAMLHAAKAFDASLQACRMLKRRGIFLTMFGEQIPTGLPPTVRWFPYVPLCQLLPYCAAVVHHGGIGSTAEALRAGTPQIVVPMAFDQFDNGARVRALGAGISIPRRRYRGRTVARALDRLLRDDSAATSCRELASRFHDVNAAQVLCEQLEAMSAVAGAIDNDGPHR